MDLGLLDPDDKVNSLHATMKFLKDSSVEDYTTILDHNNNNNGNDSDWDCVSLLFVEPIMVFIPS